MVSAQTICYIVFSLSRKINKLSGKRKIEFSFSIHKRLFVIKMRCRVFDKRRNIRLEDVKGVEQGKIKFNGRGGGFKAFAGRYLIQPGFGLVS